MFIALSRNDNNSNIVKKNIKSYIALGPVAWVGNCRSLFLRSLADNVVFIDTIIALGVK
jgi:hypothetical protein